MTRTAILKALRDGYTMYRYPAYSPAGIIVCKGSYNIDPHVVQSLVDDGCLTTRIESGEAIYSLTDKGRVALE